MSEDRFDRPKDAKHAATACEVGDAHRQEVEQWLEGLVGNRAPEEGSAYDGLDAQVAALVRAQIAESRVTDASIARVARRIDQILNPKRSSWRPPVLATGFAAGVVGMAVTYGFLLLMLERSENAGEFAEYCVSTAQSLPEVPHAKPRSQLDHGSGRGSWIDTNWQVAVEDPSAAARQFAHDLACADVEFTFESGGLIRAAMPREGEKMQGIERTLRIGSNEYLRIAPGTVVVVQFVSED